MIGPVSGTGRTMMASLQQAIQKGMPPDQAVQYVKSMATQGVAPLADLYAMMNQFQRLKQQKVTPPQTPPTIKDQLDALDQQQQMPQQGGIAQLQAGPPAAQPMDRGLGAIDAGLMEYPKFASGGVVALAEGGGLDVEGIYSRGKPEGYDRFGDLEMSMFTGKAGVEDLARLFAMALSRNDFDTASRLEPFLLQKGVSQSELGEIRKQTARGVRAVKESATPDRATLESQFFTGQSAATPPPAPAAPPAAPVAAPPAPVVERRAPVMAAPAAAPPPRQDKTEDYYKELRDFRQREKLGGAREEMRQFLTSEEKRLEKTYGEDKRLAFAEIGFKMAAAASRPGATFLGALAEGALSGTQAMRAMNKELAENKRLLKQTAIKLKEADELEKEGDYKAAMGLYREARNEELKLYEMRQNLIMDQQKLALQSKGLDIQSEQATATRDLTELYRSGQERDRKIALREQILGRSAYPTLELQAANTDDPEKLADLQKKMDAIMTEANRRAGLLEGMAPEDVTTTSTAIEYYVPGKGLMKSPGG